MSEGSAIISIDIDGAIIPRFEVPDSLTPLLSYMQEHPYKPYIPDSNNSIADKITITVGAWVMVAPFACMVWNESMERLIIYGVWREYPPLEPWQQAYAEHHGTHPVLARYRWDELVRPFAANPAPLKQWRDAFVAGAEWSTKQ